MNLVAIVLIERIELVVYFRSHSIVDQLLFCCQFTVPNWNGHWKKKIKVFLGIEQSRSNSMFNETMNQSIDPFIHNYLAFFPFESSLCRKTNNFILGSSSYDGRRSPFRFS